MYVKFSSMFKNKNTVIDILNSIKNCENSQSGTST